MDAIRIQVFREDLRRGRSFPHAKAERDRGAHAQLLSGQLKAAALEQQEALARRDPSLPPIPAALQLLIEPARDARGGALLSASDIPKGWRLQVAEERQDGTLLTLLPDADTSTLEALVSSWGADERDAKGRAARGTSAVGQVERIARAPIEERMGEALAAIDLSDGTAEHVVDVELRAGSADEDGGGPSRRGTFRSYVQAAGGRVIDGEIVAEDYAVLRVRLPARAIVDLLNNRGDVLLIDLPPRVEQEARELVQAEDDAHLATVLAPSPHGPVIGIIDGGVVSRHPLLTSALAARSHRSWVPGDATTDVVGDEANHGSAVASLAALGSLREALVRQGEPVVPHGVCVARVLAGDQHSLPEDLNLPAKLQEIATHLRDQAGVRIITHSIASTSNFRSSRMSVWAERLDHVAYDDGGAGFLFVVAAGNIDGANSPSTGWLRERVQAGAYPTYLLDDRCRLRNPAHALNVLTVGGYVPEAAAPWGLRMRQGFEPLAPSSGVSPFSRSGPGYARAIKPELVEEAGNFYRDASGELNRTPRTTDVAVANPAWLSDGRRVRFTHGTSFAVPRVAHLAGRILAALPEATPDLLRALVVNSAEWPTRVARGDRDDALRTFGYGVPRAHRIFDIGGPRSVIVVEGRIPIGHVHYFMIPFPHEIFGASTTTLMRVSITLAYRAPVRRTNKRYRGTVLEWGMARRREDFESFRARFANLPEVEGVAGEADRDADDELTPVSEPPPEVDDPIGDWPWIVGRNARTRGTVQKDWFEAPVANLNQEICVAVSARRGWMSEKAARDFEQRYAVTVALEAVGTVVPLHETIKQRLSVRPRARVG